VIALRINGWDEIPDGWPPLVRPLPSPPAFPPNREIRQGESICAACGSGKSTHDNGTRSHFFVKR
jgi:hypothetical protein